jgi:cobalamin biosynthesis Mg chelatase CobN
MVRGDIVGGLKIALSRGESLQKAMQSFYNAGYKKEEIEEAARELHRELTQQRQMPQRPGLMPLQPSKTPQQEIKKLPTTQSVTTQTPIPSSQNKPKQEEVESSSQQPEQTQQPKPSPQDYYTPSPSQQVVSSYAQPERRSRVDFVTILLVIILVVLLGVLVSVFFFKSELIEFLNRFLE